MDHFSLKLVLEVTILILKNGEEENFEKGFLTARKYISLSIYFRPRQEQNTNKSFDLVPRIGMFELNLEVMAKNTSILLGDYFDNFINQQIKSGKYASASEVVRTALRMFEFEESKKRN